MKKLLLVSAMVVGLAGMSAAQVPMPFSIYAGGAISLPNAPESFADTYKTGFHAWAGVGFNAAPSFQIIGKMEYQTFGLDESLFSLAQGVSSVSGGTWKMLMFGADGRYSLGLPAAPIKPFFLGGVGLARIDVSDFQTSDPLVTSLLNAANDPVTKMYWNIGGGVELKAGPAWSLFGQIRYVSVQTEGDASAFIPISVGLKFF